MSCLDKIIGLSQTECACFDEDKPTDYNVSLSGVYLDELDGFPGLETLGSISNCEEGSIWKIMEKALEKSILQFKADMLSGMENAFKTRRPNFKGLIGDIAFNNTLILTQNKAGIRIRSHNVVGGYFDLTRIGLMFNATSSITIKVFSNLDQVNEIASYTMMTAANNTQFVRLTNPLRLPLWSETGHHIEYYLVYDLTGAYYPKNNKLDCGCGKKMDVSYKNWISLEGIRGNAGTMYNDFQSSNELNGLVIEGSFTCDSSRLICSDEYPLDFNSGRALQMAYAVRFKTAQSVIQKVLDTNEINRPNMLSREALYGKRNSFGKKYEEWIEYLVTNTEILNSDCLVCRENHNFQRGTIFS